jgi:hypothetical protein
MGPARFADRSPQDLYFPEGHKQSEIFKGMAVILQKQGYGDMLKVHAECPDFKCKPGTVNSCCQRILYNEPDFVEVESLLVSACRACSFHVLFLPKFHCELNFIEQCWGYTKRVYWLNPPLSQKEDLQANVLAALKAISLATMCQ